MKIFIVFACLLLFGANAIAQQISMHCIPESAYLDDFKARYGEIPMLRGITGDGPNYGEMLFLSNAATGTWTIALIVKQSATAERMACSLAGGQELTPQAAPEKGPAL